MIEIERATTALAPNSAQEQNKMSSEIKARNPKQRSVQLYNLLASACAVFLMLASAQASIAQQTAPAKPVTMTVATTSAAKPPSPKPGTEEGEPIASGNQSNGAGNGTIKVHGHWVMNVRNPDGTLADHREFENKLVINEGGDAFLIGLLAGYYVPGDFAIQLNGKACGSLGYCYIVKSTSTQPGKASCDLGATTVNCNPSLGYTVVLAPATGSTSLILSGYIALPDVGTIDEVTTFFNACGSINGYTFGSPIVAPSGPSPTPPINCFGSRSPSRSHSLDACTRTFEVSFVARLSARSDSSQHLQSGESK
jgi:hypothetical protein